VKLHYEVFGDAEPTLVLMPSNPIVYSRRWKAQVGSSAGVPRIAPPHPSRYGIQFDQVLDSYDGWRETRYYAEPFEASEWRAQWVERLEESPASGGPST
jgi:hypothetical protein